MVLETHFLRFQGSSEMGFLQLHGYSLEHFSWFYGTREEHFGWAPLIWQSPYMHNFDQKMGLITFLKVEIQPKILHISQEIMRNALKTTPADIHIVEHILVVSRAFLDSSRHF